MHGARGLITLASILALFSTLIQQDQERQVVLPRFGEDGLKIYDDEQIASVFGEATPCGFWRQGSGVLPIPRDQALALLELFRTAEVDLGPFVPVLEVASFVIVDKQGDNLRISVYWRENRAPFTRFSINGIRCISKQTVTLDGHEISGPFQVSAYLWRLEKAQGETEGQEPGQEAPQQPEQGEAKED